MIFQPVDNTQFDPRAVCVRANFECSMSIRVPLVFTFSASDPTCGAGMQADALTLAAMGVHPLTVLTGLTAQNTVGVAWFEPVDERAINRQLDVLLDDGLAPSAIKVGVLGSTAAVDAVFRLKTEYPDAPLVVDPVRASGRGDALGAAAVWSAMQARLFPLIDLITPNWPEAQALTGQGTPADAAASLLNQGVRAVLIKGEHLDEVDVVNRLYWGQEGEVAEQAFPCARLPHQYHGSGCTLASACAGAWAQGLSLNDAVGLALEFTWQALSHGFAIGQGQRIPDRLHLMQQLAQGRGES